MSIEALINNKANRENDFALGIAAESPQRSEDLERKARPEPNANELWGELFLVKNQPLRRAASKGAPKTSEIKTIPLTTKPPECFRPKTRKSSDFCWDLQIKA